MDGNSSRTVPRFPLIRTYHWDSVVSNGPKGPFDATIASSEAGTMDKLNVAQLIVSTIAAMLIATPLLLLSYVAGRRSHAQGRSRRLDQLSPEVFLGGSIWNVEYDGDEDPAIGQRLQLSLEQVGCRILATGQSTNGMYHSLEGVIHRGRLCCVSIDEGRDGAWLGTVTAELHPGGQQMTGMRTRWSVPSQTMMVRRATLTRVANA